MMYARSYAGDYCGCGTGYDMSSSSSSIRRSQSCSCSAYSRHHAHRRQIDAGDVRMFNAAVLPCLQCVASCSCAAPASAPGGAKPPSCLRCQPARGLRYRLTAAHAFWSFGLAFWSFGLFLPSWLKPSLQWNGGMEEGTGSSASSWFPFRQCRFPKHAGAELKPS
jgi:hypothetical protein